MKTTPLLIAMLLTGSVGCVNVHPVGPMTKVFGDKPLFTAPKMTTALPGTPEEKLAPAPKPVPPSELVRPEDVTREDPQAAARKLQSEFEVDRKSISTAPRTAEISVYKNGQKVQ